MASRKRRRINYLLFLLALLFLIIIGGFSVVYNFANRVNSVNGTFVETYDVTDMIVANIVDWLTDVDNDDIDYEWVRSKTDSIAVDIELKMEKTQIGKGNYVISVNEDSYNSAVQKSYELSTACLYEIIRNNLKERGYNEELSDENIEAFAQNILGCDIKDYLRNNNVGIIPEFNDFSIDYNESGSYSVDYKKIVFNHNNADEAFDYIYSGNALIIPSKNVIYRKQVQQ